jgi:hypothetical protein
MRFDFCRSSPGQVWFPFALFCRHVRRAPPSNSPASLDRSGFYATVRSITGSCDGRTDADLGEHGVAAEDIQLRRDRKIEGTDHAHINSGQTFVFRAAPDGRAIEPIVETRVLSA